MIAAAVAGSHYPRSLGELRSWVAADADCQDYLEWLRWPHRFVCPDCGRLGGWRLSDGRFRCAACRSCTSVTAGTIFDRTRTPLTVWFTACWLFATQKDGVSAQSLQRALEIGSYQTAWAMLHRLHSVLVVPGRERLTGTVEVDETFIGGEEPGLRGGRAKGKKSLVGVAIEVKEPKGLGRCRMAILTDASAASLHPFVAAHVEPGATVITDAWQGYSGINDLGYTRDRRSQRAARLRGDDPFGLLPGVHRVASLAKRWLLGTHQGSVDELRAAMGGRAYDGPDRRSVVYAADRRPALSPRAVFVHADLTPSPGASCGVRFRCFSSAAQGSSEPVRDPPTSEPPTSTHP